MSRSIGARGHRNPFDPETLRAFVREGLDTTQVRRAFVGWDGQSGTDHLEVTEHDIAVCVTTIDGVEITARLFASGSVWRLPPIGDECLVIAPEGEFASIGAASVLWPLRAPPSNASATRTVVDIPADGLLLGNEATKGVNREGDPIEPGTIALTVVPSSPTGTGGTITLTYAPPDGAPQSMSIALVGVLTMTTPPGTPASITLGGRTGIGSATVKAQD